MEIFYSETNCTQIFYLFSMPNLGSMQTTISSAILKKALFRGTLLAGLGMVFFFYGGLHLSVDILEKWGLLLWAGGFGCIILGLLPYKKLLKLQLHPHRLIVSEGYLDYYVQEKKMLSIPLEAIQSIDYIDAPLYGIALLTYTNSVERIRVHDRLSQAQKMRKQGKVYNTSLFFPYFNHYAFKQLLEELNPLP